MTLRRLPSSVMPWKRSGPPPREPILPLLPRAAGGGGAGRAQVVGDAQSLHCLRQSGNDRMVRHRRVFRGSIMLGGAVQAQRPGGYGHLARPHPGSDGPANDYSQKTRTPRQASSSTAMAVEGPPVPIEATTPVNPKASPPGREPRLEGELPLYQKVWISSQYHEVGNPRLKANSRHSRNG